jgi:hypothetical protein
MYKYEDLLLKDFATSTATLGTSDTQSKNTASPDSDLEEYTVYSAVYGTATVEWDWEIRRWKPIPKRLVLLCIKDYPQEISSIGEYIAGSNPTTYDPPYLLHVGQSRDSPEGNCYKYHLKVGETPCTSWYQCSKNEETRLESERQEKAQQRGRPLRKRAEKKKRGKPKR